MSFFFAIAAFPTLRAQSPDSLVVKSSWFKVNVHAGIEFSDLGDVKSFFTGYRDQFKEAGIRMPDQPVFPYSNSFGASVLFSLKDRMFFGAGFEHSGTSAYSLFADPDGSVDLKSSLTMDKFFITGQYILPYDKYFSPLAEMNLGMLSAKYEFTSKIALNPFFAPHLDQKLSGKRNTLLISLFLGAQNNIYENIVLIEKLGYQFSDINGMAGDMDTNGKHTLRNIYVRFDFRGVLLQLGAEYQF